MYDQVFFTADSCAKKLNKVRFADARSIFKTFLNTPGSCANFDMSHMSFGCTGAKI